ncbi:hypothetical protein [Angelakisella massiliensis]|mgnify:CR=1 FL=1|uniref:hypothetical protein n=1 Tax=Angelakisella massiliensis TaxID=1871018 RepID=UPI0024B072A4|nr:hypothetical protein [Angelakisella massiliensis]
MKFGLRTPSPMRSLKARTTGKMKRSLKRAINPCYGKKGMGLINDPKKAVYNKIYNKTTIGVSDLIPKHSAPHFTESDSINPAVQSRFDGSILAPDIVSSLSNSDFFIYARSVLSVADGLSPSDPRLSEYSSAVHFINCEIDKRKSALTHRNHVTAWIVYAISAAGAVFCTWAESIFFFICIGFMAASLIVAIDEH